jgi:hypothetical protein
MPWDEAVYTLLLSAVVSQLFPLRDHLSICGHQNFASAMETDDNRSASHFPDTVTLSVSTLFSKLLAKQSTFSDRPLHVQIVIFVGNVQL